MKYFVTGLLIGLAVLFSQCLHSGRSCDPRGGGYAGSKACKRCHEEISDDYSHSHHFQTSSIATAEELKGLIGPLAREAADLADRVYFADSSYVRVEEVPGSFLQSCYRGTRSSRSERFDIAFGSGEKAQTYAYWKDSQLLELPLTWYASQRIWANSPGFSIRRAHYERVITSRCFECHASYIGKETVQSGPLSLTEKLDRNSIVFGIDCERCHGPAAQHVRYQAENPGVKTARYIVPIKSLTRQRQLDICAACHSGNDLSPQRSIFSFVPGDTLSHFYFPEFAADIRDPDVHGKQVQLLESSLCFRRSTMTCMTCHNPHETENDKLAGFVSKCMDCHQRSAHAATIFGENEQKKRHFNLSGANCLDCHMPLQMSKTIYFNSGSGEKNIPYFIRTHKIAVYK
ncbi:MAG: cytochrome c3 family protein [Bacteroidetes bacterium]|nr:cytochrome c3 family protein [Bacteroidota bacterium]